MGYERGTAISAAWEEATTEGAIEVASYVDEHRDELAGIKKDDSEDARLAKFREFASRFVERAFRRPIDDEQRSLYIDRQFEAAPNLETALKRVVLLTLKSPRFLYHEVHEKFDAYDVASRISFALWDSLPDQELLKAAAEGRLSTREQRSPNRPVGWWADLRTRAKMLEFFHRWLKVENAPDLAKAPEHFEAFSDAIIADLRTSLDLFLHEIVWEDVQSDFRRLLLDEPLYLNGRLAEFYGADLPPDSPFAPITEGMGERAGLLSHPYLMANFAYTETTSPIHRGVFLVRSVLGQRLRPPPAAFSPFGAQTCTLI